MTRLEKFLMGLLVVGWLTFLFVVIPYWASYLERHGCLSKLWN